MIAGFDELALVVPKESVAVVEMIQWSTPQPRTGLLALTFGTLLSSQGADAHRRQPFGWSRGQPVSRYAAGFAVSNPEVCRTTRFHVTSRAGEPHGEGEVEGLDPTRRDRLGTRGVAHST
jgi:hypothetical protein